MSLLVTGGTGLTGELFLRKLAAVSPDAQVNCLVRSSSDRRPLVELNLALKFWSGDSAQVATWESLLSQIPPATIVHIASLQHVPVILQVLQRLSQRPRLIVIGTTSVHSRYHSFAERYKTIERQLADYPGPYCLLRPTMIYGSARDRNLHKLIQFCSRYGCFPVFGAGTCQLQPVHADDLAAALLTACQRPWIVGSYDVSGGSAVTLPELLAVVARNLSKPVRPLYLPLGAGVQLATVLEALLGKRSPLRREQVLRLQEDKAYPHDAARRDLDFFPCSLEVGLRREVELLRAEGKI